MSSTSRDTAEDYTLVAHEADIRPEEESEPSCPRCGGELVEVEGGGLSGPVGALLVFVGLVCWVLMPYFKVPLMLTAGGAAFILGVVMLRRQMWWVCLECGEQFRRRLPPRGFERDEVAREESEQSGPWQNNEG